MQTRKNRKNKTFNLKNRGGGPKTKKWGSGPKSKKWDSGPKSKKWGSGPKSKKSKLPPKKKIEEIASAEKIEKIASAEKININPIPLSISPQRPSVLLSFLPNKKKEYENKKKEHEKKKENYEKSQKLNEIYGEFYIKLNELIVLFKSVDTDYLFKSVDTDYINKNKLQSIIHSYNDVKVKIVDGLNLYREITHLEDQPDINIDNLITERQTYIKNIEGYETKINNIIERINKAKTEEIKNEEKYAEEIRVEKENKKRRDKEYNEKKAAKKEEKKAATKIQSLVRGITARQNIKTMREFAKTKKAKESAERKKSEAFAKIIDKTPQEITSEEWSTFFEENVKQIKGKIQDIEIKGKIQDIESIMSIININLTNGFREYYPNDGAKKYSHVIFFILGFLTPLLEKKGVTMYLKGGQAIHLNRQSIIQKNPKLEYPDYPSNDIDIDFMIHTNSILKKIDLCYMIRNFIYWCVKDDDNVNIQHIQYRKNLSSIENDKTNVLKISYREFPTSGKIFALIDFSFKETLHDINKLFTTDYIESMDVNVNETTYRYKFQSLLSLILEKMFILLHEDDPNIDIADELDIINKFKATLQYTLQLYIAQPDKTIENISTEYSKLFQVNKETIQNFIKKELYPEREKQTKDMKDDINKKVIARKNAIINVIGQNKLINKGFDDFLEPISKLDTYEKLCHHIITNKFLVIQSIKNVLKDMRTYKSSTNSTNINLRQITNKIFKLQELEEKLSDYFNGLC